MRRRPTRVLLQRLPRRRPVRRGYHDDKGSAGPEQRPRRQRPRPTDSDTTGPDTTEAPQGDPFGWDDFGDDGAVQTGNLEVPIDYSDPSKGTFDLYVARHLADPAKRIGSLLVNPGVPASVGSDFAVFAEQIYGADAARLTSTSSGGIRAARA